MAGDALEMATVKRALTGVDVVTQSLGVSAGPEIIFKPTPFFSNSAVGQRNCLKSQTKGTSPGPTTQSFEPEDFPETSQRPAIGGL